MPQQNGGWAVEAQRGTTKQPAAARRGRHGAVLLLLLLLRVGALCASAASAALAASSATLRRAPFRFLLAADAIVAVYSAFETAAAAWEVARGATLLPEAMQLWFDFAHDQVTTTCCLLPVYSVGMAPAGIGAQELIKLVHGHTHRMHAGLRLHGAGGGGHGGA